MASLTTKLPWPQAQPLWASQLNPILSNRMVQGQQIDGIILKTTTPLIINHSLAQLPVGWFIVDNIISSNVWRTQPFNVKTITLEASANTTISIWIY